MENSESLRFVNFEISAHAGREDLVFAHFPRMAERVIRDHRQEHGEELEYLGVDIERSLQYVHAGLKEGRLKFRLKESV